MTHSVPIAMHSTISHAVSMNPIILSIYVSAAHWPMRSSHEACFFLGFVSIMITHVIIAVRITPAVSSTIPTVVKNDVDVFV